MSSNDKICSFYSTIHFNFKLVSVSLVNWTSLIISVAICSSKSRDLWLRKPCGLWPQATMAASGRKYSLCDIKNLWQNLLISSTIHFNFKTVSMSLVTWTPLIISVTICPSKSWDLWLIKPCGLWSQATMAASGREYSLYDINNHVASSHKGLIFLWLRKPFGLWP